MSTFQGGSQIRFKFQGGSSVSNSFQGGSEVFPSSGGVVLISVTFSSISVTSDADSIFVSYDWSTTGITDDTLGLQAGEYVILPYYYPGSNISAATMLADVSLATASRIGGTILTVDSGPRSPETTSGTSFAQRIDGIDLGDYTVRLVMVRNQTPLVFETGTSQAFNITLASALTTWNEAAWTGTRYTGLTSSGAGLTGGSIGNASSRTLTSTETANAGAAKPESVTYSVGRPDATYAPTSFSLTHNVTQASGLVPTTNTYSDWAFVSVANAGTEALTTTGTFGSWTTTGAPSTPDTQPFLNEIRSRTDTYTTSGIRHNESRVCTADSCDGALTRVENQPNTTRRPVVTESRNNVTANTNFVAVDPTISFTNTVTTFVRTGSLQLTWTTTAGSFPISTVTFADDHAAVSVSSTGVVTSTGAVGSIVTATVTDSAGNTGTDTITITAENHAAPTINVTPGSRSTVAAAGSGTAFSVVTTGTDTTVTVAGENLGALPTWLTVGANGSWSATANTGALRSAVIRFTVRDQLNQSAFEEVSVSQAAAAATVNCFMYTFTHGTSGLFGSNIGGYTLCDGTVISNRSLANPLTVCAREGTLTTVNGVWSAAGASCS